MSFLGIGKSDEPVINPLYAAWVGSIIRTVLPYVAGGVTLYSDSEIEKLSGALVATGMLIWSMYQKLSEKREKNQLAARAGISVQQAKAEVASPYIASPSATAPENIVPVAVLPPLA